MEDVKFNLEKFDEETLKNVQSILSPIIQDNKEAAEILPTFALFNSICSELKYRTEAEEIKVKSRLESLNEMWAGEYIKIEKDSMNGNDEITYYKISRIGKDPYNESRYVAYTELPAIIVNTTDDSKIPNYEIRYLEVVDNKSKEAIIKGLDIDFIDPEKILDFENTYKTIYHAAVDYYDNLNVV